MSGLATFMGQFWGIAFLLLFVCFLIVNVGAIKYFIGRLSGDLKEIKSDLKSVADGVVDNRTEIKLLKQRLEKK